MKKRSLLLFFLTALAITGMAQTRRCPEYDRILGNLQRTFNKDLLDSALLQVRYLRACTPGDEAIADEWTQKIFDRIKAQKTGADLARDRAKTSEQKADLARKKAERLTAYFNFGNENAAWAYQNGRFAVIDRDGNQLTDYIYETPDSFANGIALAQANGQYVFMSDQGKELTGRYDYVIQDADGFYRARGGEALEPDEWIRISTRSSPKTKKIVQADLETYQNVSKL